MWAVLTALFGLGVGISDAFEDVVLVEVAVVLPVGRDEVGVLRVWHGVVLLAASVLAPLPGRPGCHSLRGAERGLRRSLPRRPYLMLTSHGRRTSQLGVKRGPACLGSRGLDKDEVEEPIQEVE